VQVTIVGVQVEVVAIYAAMDRGPSLAPGAETSTTVEPKFRS